MAQDGLDRFSCEKAALRRVALQSIAVVLGCALFLGVGARASAQLIISEVQAINETCLPDEDGDFSDWIELYNPGAEPVDLDGWFLSDNPNNLEKWQLPQVILGPGEFRVVFASTKDRATPGGVLHTDFRLSSEGEFLALVEPDGETVAHAYNPAYPSQAPNASYGCAFATETLAQAGARTDLLIPHDGSLGAEWTQLDFAPDAAWITTTTGVGFGKTDVQVAAGPGEGAALLVDLDSSGLTSGTRMQVWRNAGTLGDFSAIADEGWTPHVEILGGVPGVVFDGNDWMRSHETASVSVTGQSDWSVEVWVFNPEIAVKESMVNWAKNTGRNMAAVLNYGTARGYGAIEHAGSDLGYAGGTPTSGTWHHIAVTYAGGLGGLESIYVDGVLNTTQTKTLKLHGPEDQEAIPVLLGAATGSVELTNLTAHFTGALAAVRIHPGALAPEQVQGNFLADAAYYGVQAPPSVVPGQGMSRSIRTDLRPTMQGAATSAYLRIPFEVVSPERYNALWLDMDYSDGFIAYLNGVEVARANAPTGAAWNSVATAQRVPAATDRSQFLSQTVYVPLNAHLAELREGENVLAIHGLSRSLDDTVFYIVPKLVAACVDAQAFGFLGKATPGRPNAPSGPRIGGVEHAPAQPRSGEAIAVTARIEHETGITSAVLLYQIVEPGHYIPATIPLTHDELVALTYKPESPWKPNPEFDGPANWTEVAMREVGAGSGAFAAEIPAQNHRTLVRYRVAARSADGAETRAPNPADLSLNYACFVYDGVPDYVAETRSVQPDGPGHVYPAKLLESLPVYHLITRSDDMWECLAYTGENQIGGNQHPGRKVFNWEGAFVYEGIVHDHVRYRLRGANGRYHEAGKRNFRIRFMQGNYLQARDRYGEPYPEKFRTLNLGKMFGNRLDSNSGLAETANEILWNLVGVPSPHTHWFHFRVIDGVEEAPAGENGQYYGDFWGMGFNFEDYDTPFLQARNLPDGNLYKLSSEVRGGLKHQRVQGALAAKDALDYDYIRKYLSPTQSEEWLRANVNYDMWYRFHTVAEALRHYDYWVWCDKNVAWYFRPAEDGPTPNAPYGQLHYLPYDSDATWGPTWNAGEDEPKWAIYASPGHPAMRQEYRNYMREFRDLVWQPEVINPMIDELASIVAAFAPADLDRWLGAPADAGTMSPSVLRSVEWKVQDMKNFAWKGGSWPDQNVGLGGSAATLDRLMGEEGDDDNVPEKPIARPWPYETMTFIGEGARVLARVPTDDSLSNDWIEPDFAPDDNWTEGTDAVGFGIEAIQSAGELLVDLDAAGLSSSSILYQWPNAGTMGDFFANLSEPRVERDALGVACVAFDGEDDFMRTRDFAPLSVTGRENWSVEVWVKNPEIADEEAVFGWAVRTGPGSGRAAQMQYGSSAVRGVIEHWQDADIGWSGAPPEAGAWHHIAITYSGGVGGLERIYVDGILNTSKTQSLQLHGINDDWDFPIVLGAASANVDVTDLRQHFSGLLAQVRFHSGELSPEQVRNNYAVDAARFGHVAPTPDAFVDAPFIGQDLEAPMRGANATAYARYLFDATVAQLDGLKSLALHMLYDDGFVAYLNGVEVARRNAPEALAWNTHATAERDVRNPPLGSTAQVGEFIDLTPHLPALREGENVLAIQGLNVSADDGDFLIYPELLASTVTLAPKPFMASDSLVFHASDFRDPQGDDTFAAMRWRLAEISDRNRPDYDPAKRKYEITALWESEELTKVQREVRVPAEGLEAGRVYRVRVQMLDDTGRWSHWSEPVEFTLIHSGRDLALIEHLRITEVMYNPPGGSDFEYIEIYNTSKDATLDLGGVQFNNGVTYAFPAGTTLAPGAFLLVVRTDDFAAFRRHYGIGDDVAIFGPYEGNLNNAGERLTLATAAGTEILSFRYGDGNGWPQEADGDGSSLVIRDPAGTTPAAYENPESWQPSAEFGGTPGWIPKPAPPSATWVLY